MKTCTFNNALYANGRYYVHGFKTGKGFTVIVGKKAQWRRGAQHRVLWNDVLDVATLQHNARD